LVGPQPIAEQASTAAPALLILAAGIGRRYGGVKQITPVGPSGEILLDYSVYDALHAGFNQIVFVVSEEVEETLRPRMADRLGNACRIDYVRQGLTSLPPAIPIPAGRRKPWGTGHAVLVCQDTLHTPFGVINADDFYGRGSYVALASRLRTARNKVDLLDLCMIGFPLESTLTEHGQVARGVCVVDQGGHLVEVRERTRIEKRAEGIGFVDDVGGWNRIPPGSLASMNMWGLTPGVFPELREGFREFLQTRSGDLSEAEYLLPEAINQMLTHRRATVQVLGSSETWSGVTYREDAQRCRERIQALVDSRAYPRRLWG
jgi:hypothetical protein